MPEILGPIILRDKKDGRSEKTAPQILSNPTFDSRVYPNYFTIPYHIIRQLRTDPTVQLARWAVLSPMIHTPWMYEKGKNGTQEMIDFLEETFLPLRDQLLARAVFGVLDFGWQPFEVIFKPEDGYIYIDDFKSLLQDYTTILVYVNTGRFAGFANEAIGMNASVIVTETYAQNSNFEVEGTDWYGSSVFRNLYGVINSWNTVQETANRYDKKIAGATWVIYFPVGETLYNGIKTANDVIAAALLNSLEASGQIAVPDDIQVYLDDTLDREVKGAWRIELITAKNSSEPGFINRQKYLDALKMRAFALTERSVLEGTHGTKAEADVHGDVSLSNVDSRHRLICSGLNVQAVPQALSFNFGKKYAYSAYIKPAPLVDTQFATIKAIYERIIMDGDALAAEAKNLNMRAMRDELGLSSVLGGDGGANGLDIQKDQPKIGQASKVTTEKVTSNG